MIPAVASSTDLEVPPKAQRRIFTAEEKKRTLEETDRALANGGGVGAFCASRTASAPSKTLVDFASPVSDGTTISITTPAWA